MVVEQKFKVLWKAEKEIYQNMNSHLRELQTNSAEFREFAENSQACIFILTSMQYEEQYGGFACVWTHSQLRRSRGEGLEL